MDYGQTELFIRKWQSQTHHFLFYTLDLFPPIMYITYVKYAKIR
jgi:hypothetical protein